MGKIIGKGITFDDVLLVPQFSSVIPNDVVLSTQLTKKIRLNIPLNLMRTTRHFLSRSRTQSVVQKPCVDIPAPLLRRW